MPGMHCGSLHHRGRFACSALVQPWCPGLSCPAVKAYGVRVLTSETSEQGSNIYSNCLAHCRSRSDQGPHPSQMASHSGLVIHKDGSCSLALETAPGVVEVRMCTWIVYHPGMGA